MNFDKGVLPVSDARRRLVRAGCRYPAAAFGSPPQLAHDEVHPFAGPEDQRAEDDLYPDAHQPSP